jgi:hypothetical protein
LHKNLKKKPNSQSLVWSKDKKSAKLFHVLFEENNLVQNLKLKRQIKEHKKSFEKQKLTVERIFPRRNFYNFNCQKSCKNPSNILHSGFGSRSLTTV